MERLFFTLGSLSAFSGVALGAFAAHALKGRVEPDLLAIFETGVRYQMYHALALLAVGLGLHAVAGQGRKRQWLAVCRRYNYFFRQFVCVEPQRHALARRGHADRRVGFAGGMVVSGMGSV